MSTLDDLRQGVSKGWHRIPPIVRDFGVAVLVILVLMSSLWIYTGQPLTQAPLVVVESGSMMHDEEPWGRLGTIDPGDLILVKDIDRPQRLDVVTLYGARSATDGQHPGEGDREGFGLEGDVVIYRQDQCQRQDPTPIIHRAVTWVEVTGTEGNRRYSYHDADGNWLVNQPSVHLPALSLSHNSNFASSGWITKGDNPVTNKPADQAGICRDLLIQPEWLIGKARGEIPWVGLLKFMVQGNNVNNPPADWCTPFQAVAPCDLFQALFLSLFILVAIPLVWDVVHRLRGKKKDGDGDEDAHEAAFARPPPHLTERERQEVRRPPRPPPARPRPRSEADERQAPARERPRWAPPEDDRKRDE